VPLNKVRHLDLFPSLLPVAIRIQSYVPTSLREALGMRSMERRVLVT
jgi:hypothetical protein